MITANSSGSSSVVSLSKWQIYSYSSLLMITVFTGAMCYSLQAPIYPQEAEAKGVSPSQYGFVFGVFQLVVFISAPLFGTYAKAIGPIFMYNSGVFLSSGCTLLFGFLDKSPPGVTFLSLSIAIRAIGALGDSAVYTSSLIISSQLHPEAMATALAILETSFGVGNIIGPSLGGYLYEIGGFPVPFFVVGGISMLQCFVALIAFRNISFEAGESTRNGPKVLKLARNPFVIITTYAIFAVSISLGFTQAFLEPHLSSLHLTSSKVGLLFMAMGGTYAISSLVFGRIADKIGYFSMFSTLGLISSIIGLLLLGPAPFIHISMSVGLAVASLCLCGAGIGCVLMNSVMELLNIIADNGPINVATQGFVSGLYNSIFAFGAFIGPTIGGPLYDSMGFSLASMVFLGMELLAVILVFGIVIYSISRKTIASSPLISIVLRKCHGLVKFVSNTRTFDLIMSVKSNWKRLFAGTNGGGCTNDVIAIGLHSCATNDDVAGFRVGNSDEKF